MAKKSRVKIKIVLLLMISRLATSMANDGLKSYFMEIECDGLTREQCDAKAEKTVQKYCETHEDNLCRSYDIFEQSEVKKMEIDYSTVTECIDENGSLTKCKCEATKQGISCQTGTKNNYEPTSLKPVLPTTSQESSVRNISPYTPKLNSIFSSEATKAEVGTYHEETSLAPVMPPTGSISDSRVIPPLTSEGVAISSQETTKADYLQQQGWRLASSGIFYKFFSDRVVYAEAKRTCKEQGAILGSKVVRDAFSEIQALVKSHGLNTWIGLNDIEIEGTWAWEDDIPSDGSTQWYGTNPDNYGEGEDCGYVERANLGINDVPCTYRFSFVCEQNA